MESWVWQPEALARLSKHHVTGNTLPENLVQKLLAARNANAGLRVKRQIMLAMFDQAIHSVEKADTAAVFAKLAKEVLGVEATPGTNMVPLS